MINTKSETRRNRATRTRRAALAVVALLSALAALAPGAANAGTYHMYNCHVAGHETGNHGPWTYSTAYGSPGTTFYSACGGAGGAAGYEFGPYAAGYLGANSRVDLTLSKDNFNISISGMKLWLTALSATAAGYPAGPITATLWKDGAKHVEWSGGPSANYASTPLEINPARTVTLSLACAGSGLGCMPDGGFPLRVNGVQTDLVENVPPGASVVGGPLLSPGAQTGTKTVTIQGTDPDSGVRKLDVLLGDQVVASIDYDRDWSRPLGEQKSGTCAYDSWRACDAAQTVDLGVNTKLVSDGAYALTARVTDAAGNTTTTSPQSVTIDNVPDPAPPIIVGPPGRDGNPGANGPTGPGGTATILTRNGTNATAQAALRARFVGFSSNTIRAAYGKKVQLTGEVLAPGGAPITGAKVSVLVQDKTIGATMRPAGEVVTDARGRFIYTMFAKRSQTVRFGYRANLEDVDFAKTVDFRLGVIPKVTFKTNKRSLRNRQSVRFSGAIAGAPATAKKVVELQVRKGRAWMTFATSRLKNGRFSYAYKFKRTHGRVTYLFRARVREEAGFPFLSGASKTRKVTVRG